MQMLLVNRNTALVVALLVVLSLSACGQIRIQAAPGIKHDNETISLLIDATCRVVAPESGLTNASIVRVPVRLNLEEGDKGVVGESLHRAHRVPPIMSGLTTGGRGHIPGPDSGTLSHDASFPSEERRFPKLSQFLQMNEEDPEPVSSVCQPRDRSAP